MNPHLQPLVQSLHEARKRKGISQRALGEQVGLPQSHVSRIESGAIDVQASNLVALARALDLELVLIPRQLLPTVAELQRGIESTPVHAAPPTTASQLPAYRLPDGDDDA